MRYRQFKMEPSVPGKCLIECEAAEVESADAIISLVRNERPCSFQSTQTAAAWAEYTAEVSPVF